MKYLALFVTVLSLFSCSTFKKIVNPEPTQPTICETIQGPSLICESCAKFGINAEELETIIIAVDYAAIGSGVYSAGSAIDVLKQMRALVSSSISYRYLRTWLLGTLIDSPRLVAISELIPNTTAIMYVDDRIMIINFIDRHIRNLEIME